MIASISTTFYKIKDSYQEAKKAKQIPIWVITIFVIYVPFEDFITAWLPLPKSISRFSSELILYGFSSKVVYEKFRFGGGLRKTPLDLVLFFLFTSAMISIFVNGASIPGSIDNLRTNWRYICLYYTLVNIYISEKSIEKLINILKKISIIQSIIASVQFFLPSRINIMIAGGGCDKAEFKGASCGTFIDSTPLSGFLLIFISLNLILVYMTSQTLIPDGSSLKELLLLYFGLFASKKRAALLVGLFIPFLIFSYLKKRMYIFKLIWIGLLMIFIVALVSPFLELKSASEIAAQTTEESPGLIYYFGALFSKEYWRANFNNSRGWMIISICQGLIKSGSWFGFGPELGSVRRGIEVFLSSPDDQEMLRRNLYVVDDPYWFAILAYFGIVGLLLYWLVIFRLNQTAKRLFQMSNNKNEKFLALTLRTITLISFLYCFVERLFRVRGFSFYFWLIAGLVTNRYCNYIDKYNEYKSRYLNKKDNK